ncbi:MAG: hypothetical protein OXB84_07590, partial [Halobacteriovoraceae bacterium]|nr:hypothetical protein [Halobacteriovoraceae bacterium]
MIFSFFFIFVINTSFSNQIDHAISLENFESDYETDKDIPSDQIRHILPENFESDYDTDKYKASFNNIQNMLIPPDDLFLEKKDSTPYFSSSKELEKKDRKKNFDLTQFNLLGKFDESQKYLEHENSEIISSIDYQVKSTFSFSYFIDNYNYEGEGSALFQDIYENDNEAKRVGLFLFSYKYYLSRMILPMALGVNFGIGFNRGRGRFTGSLNRSDAFFNLWTMPLDLAFSVHLPFWRWIRITGSAGPSLMGLYQTRSDFTYDDDTKTRVQIGTGF